MAYPTAAQCTLCYASYNVTAFNDWQHERSGQVQY
jgi:hypothetical protein